MGEPENSGNLDPTSWLESHGEFLFRYAYLRVRDIAAAEDLVQETLLAALKGRSGFAGKSTVRTWLVGILRHKVVDCLRERYKGLPPDDSDFYVELDETQFHSTGEWTGHWRHKDIPAEWSAGPEELLEKQEFLQAYNLCFSDLSSRLAIVFTLAVVEERTTQEICNELSISETNLRVMLYRARKQLRDCLERRWMNRPREQR